MSDENRDWAAAWKESRLKDAPISVLEKTIANAVGVLVSDHYKAHICNIEFDTKSWFHERARITLQLEQVGGDDSDDASANEN